MCLNLLFSLPQLLFLLRSYTADPISVYSHHVCLDLPKYSVTHLYHQGAGSRSQEMVFVFYSNAETQVQMHIQKCCK